MKRETNQHFFTKINYVVEIMYFLYCTYYITVNIRAHVCNIVADTSTFNVCELRSLILKSITQHVHYNSLIQSSSKLLIYVNEVGGFGIINIVELYVESILLCIDVYITIIKS